MENDGRWTLLGAFAFLSAGMFMVVGGVEPSWYSYVAVVLAFVAAAAWTARYIVDFRRAKLQAAAADDEGL
jgi:Flp pilus assembly protein TadB